MIRLVFLLLVFTLLSILITATASYDDTITVQIPWATVVGKREDVLGSQIGVFLGLPYAKPPVGELRFQRPQSLDPYEGDTYDASSLKPPCPQRPNTNHNYSETSENCLYLNIWTPVTSTTLNSIGSLKPVFFYIYGGGFDRGSVNDAKHHGNFLSSMSNSVVVTINHRLNILGFGYGGSESMPGNMGVYDLQKALEWVNSNIMHFGGDPNQVTLFGSCSGAMVASAFALSPIVKPKLFSKIYLASSVVSTGVGFREPEYMLNLTRIVARAVGCDATDESEARQLSETQINCMKKADLTALLATTVSDELLDSISWRDGPPFTPIIGTDLIPDYPDRLVVNGLPNRRLPILFGNEENDDEIFTENWPQTKLEAIELLDSYLVKARPNVTRKQLDMVHSYYFDDVEEGNLMDIKEALTNAAGDYLHHCPLLLTTESWTRNGQLTFGYLNSYVMEGFNQTERPVGTKHGDTTYQLLGKAYREYDKFTENDRKVTRKMVKILSEFSRDRKLPWPPMLVNSSKTVLPLKWKWTRTMNPGNIFIDRKDNICHLWGRIRGFVVY